MIVDLPVFELNRTYYLFLPFLFYLFSIYFWTSSEG